MTSGRRWLGALGAVLWLMAAVACTDRSADDRAPAAGPAGTLVYVAVGASDSVGIGADAPSRDGWPEVLRRDHLPEGAELVNLAVSGATVQQALDVQLHPAVEAEPDVVTVWLNVNDLAQLVPVPVYETRLGELVRGLRRQGETLVLVANTPPLDHLPAVRSFGVSAEQVNAAVAAYNEAIARVVADTGAVLVDLHAAGLAARQDGSEASLVSADGLHPSTRGHAMIAEQFGRAYASATAPAG